MNDLIKKLDIAENVIKFTNTPKKDKKQTKIKDVVTQIKGYNMMGDLLHLPETKNGNKYLFVITDLSNGQFDMEPIKDKTAINILSAFKKILKRKYIKIPVGMLRTDNGTEFKGEFETFLNDKGVFHSVSMPYRHSQLSAVESLNKQIGYYINNYLNTIEYLTQKTFNDWDNEKILKIIRDGLNKIRYHKPLYDEKTIFNYKDKEIKLDKEPKYNIGDIVHYQLSYPENALGNKQPTSQFRTGDFRFSPIPKKIKNVLYYSGAIPYRYMLDNMPYVSFTENQLIESDENEQKFKVKKIIGRKTIKRVIYYLVWWDKHKKIESTWEPKRELIKDGLKDLLDDYDKHS